MITESEESFKEFWLTLPHYWRLENAKYYNMLKRFYKAGYREGYIGGLVKNGQSKDIIP